MANLKNRFIVGIAKKSKIISYSNVKNINVSVKNSIIIDTAIGTISKDNGNSWDLIHIEE